MRKLFLTSSMLLSAAVNAENVPNNQAKDQGFNTCGAMVNGIAEFVLNDNPHGALSTWHVSDDHSPDDRLFNSMIAVEYSDGHSIAVSNVAPTKSGKCDGSYTTVFYNASSCQVTRETAYKDWKYGGQIGGLLTLENDNGSVSKLLLPAGKGCVAVSTEVIYN